MGKNWKVQEIKPGRAQLKIYTLTCTKKKKKRCIH